MKGLSAWFVMGGASVVGLVAACGSSQQAGPPPPPPADSGPALPPPVCKTPGAANFPWFTEVTDAVGLGQSANYQPVGTCVVSADFDGDGFPDLITMRGDSTGPTVMGTRVRFLMMNRPDPSDPTGQSRIFVDVPDEAGLTGTHDAMNQRGAGIANVADLNNDGFVDVITCPPDFASNAKLPYPCVGFLNDGTGHFTIAAPSDLDAKPAPTTSAVLLDADRDGIIDFWPSGMAHWDNGPPGSSWDVGPRLFRGNGDGTFTNATAAFGLPTVDNGTLAAGTLFRQTMGITTCDIDGDGNQDVLLADYGRQENQVWVNQGGKFVNLAHQLGLDHDDNMDYSDDQSYECYCAANPGCNPPPKGAPTVPCNAFGNPYFRNWIPGQSDQPYSLGGNNFGVACVDVNDDGLPDVVFADVRHQDVGQASDRTELCINPGKLGKFTRPGNATNGLSRDAAEAWQGIDANEGDNIPVFADVDLDGRKDFFLTSTVYPGCHAWLWHQKADGTGFEEITEKSGLVHAKSLVAFSSIAQGVDFVDFDGDGDLDLITGEQNGNDAIHVYRNDIGQDSNFVRVRLVGLGAGHSNVSAIGARVRVTAGGRTQQLEVKGGEGISNVQSDFVLTFGLGSTCTVDQIEVRWPDVAGTITTYPGVLSNYTVTLHEGDPTPHYPAASQ